MSGVEYDLDKVSGLAQEWAKVEHVIQTGDEAVDFDLARAQGYALLMPHGVEALALYRDWLYRLFADVQGKAAILEDLSRVLVDARAVNPLVVESLRQEHSAAYEGFRIQWNNLFHELVWDGVTHTMLSGYVRKYEIEWPLVYLAHLRDAARTGEFDPKLDRFRDRKGELRKGVLIGYIKAGFSRYPALQASVGQAYVPKLRNAIGHNNYAITEERVEVPSSAFSVSKAEMYQTMIALQDVQNAALWSVRNLDRDHSSLSRSGVIAAAWNTLGNEAEYDLELIQLAPFADLHSTAGFPEQVVVRMTDGTLHTQFGGPIPISGPLAGELRNLLRLSQQRGFIRCVSSSVMPCVHKYVHDQMILPSGEYCYLARGPARSVPLIVDTN